MKSVKDMTPAEYSAARRAAIKPKKTGMTYAERQDLIARGILPAPRDVRTMSSTDYARAKAKVIRGS